MIQVDLDADEYRELMHVPKLDGISTPDQWVDWGGHTVQVDPMGADPWIRDDTDHFQVEASRHLERQYNARDIRELRGWANVQAFEAPVYFTPSQYEMSGLDKWPTPMSAGCKMWRGAKRDGRRFGKLPALTAMLYDNTLPEKAVYEIEAEIRESDRTAAARLYRRDGAGTAQARLYSR